jgi:hypothetical protein
VYQAVVLHCVVYQAVVLHCVVYQAVVLHFQELRFIEFLGT